MNDDYQTGQQSSEPSAETLRHELGGKAREASRHFAEQGKARAEALSGKAADALDDMEAAADAEADELERRGWTDLSEYVREMADGIGGLSENLRHRSVDELIRSASELAQRNTALFVLGSVAIGFGLSRFVKAGTSDTGAWHDDDAAYAYPAGEAPVSEPMSSDEYRPYDSH